VPHRPRGWKLAWPGYGAWVSQLPWIGAEEIGRLLPVTEAADALERALLRGLDPAQDPARIGVDVAAGELLLMPSSSEESVGVKIVALAAGNAARGLPRIHGVYLLLHAETLVPEALLDGSALTALRTPAVSALAVRRLARPDAARLVVFGSGPQAWGHVQAVLAVRPVTEVAVVGLSAERAGALAARVAELGVAVSVPEELNAVIDAVRAGEVIVCATSSAVPLFDGALVQDSACVVAVGSHRPDRRELDANLMGRAHVVVEDRATALREAGDVAMAVQEGFLEVHGCETLAELVSTAGAGKLLAGQRADRRPTVFKSVGMGWQDLVVATEVNRRWGAP